MEVLAEGNKAGSADTEPHRAAAWYELFFDLVFVAVVAISAHVIEEHPGPQSVVMFMLLFFPLWWAWVNIMATANLFGMQYPAIGVLLVAAMPGPAAMAVAIGNGIEDYGWLYAAGAAWLRLMLLVMWLVPYRGRTTPLALWRPLAYNLATALIWLVSIAIPQPWQFVLWGAAVAAEVALLAIRSSASNEIYMRASVSHFLDRVGLIVIIVIGEAVYLSVTGLVDSLTVAGGVVALFGFVICALLARAFFRWGAPSAGEGLRNAQAIGSFGAIRDVVMYLPFVLVTALTLIAASIGIAVAHGEHPLDFSARLILAIGTGGFYLANALVGIRLGRPISGILSLAIPGIALPVLACLLTGALPAWGTLAFAALAVALLDLVSQVLSARPLAVQRPNSPLGA